MSNVAAGWEPPAIDPGTTVYHYTSPSGLVGILENRELWASESSTLNDLSEVTAGRRRIRRRIKAELRATPGDEVLRDIRDALRGSGQWERIDVRTFVLCASLERDDAAQWRLYCGKRGGFAVHLDTSKPLQVIAPPGREVPKSRFGIPFGFSAEVNKWYRVAYTKRQKRELVDHLIDWARQRRQRLEQELAGTGNGDRAADLVIDYRAEFAGAIDLASALMKPRGFRAEREVRSVAYAPLPGSLESFRDNEEMPVPYLRLAESENGARRDLAMTDRRSEETGAPDRTLPVVGVTVGPTSQFKDVRRTVGVMLSRAGLSKVKVRKSKVPLRW